MQGWSDGATFMPVDFALLSSKKAQVNGISEQIDKRLSTIACAKVRYKKVSQHDLFNQVKEDIYKLHDEGIFPSTHAINKLLGNYHLFLKPEIKKFREK